MEKSLQKIICFFIGHAEFWPDLNGTFMYCSRCHKERDDIIMTPKYKARSAKSTRYYGNTITKSEKNTDSKK